MKLDKELVRQILLEVESKDGDPRCPMILQIQGHDCVEVAHHVHLLYDAGFLDALNFSSSSGYDWQPKYLTYSGHEFLNTVRDTEIWRVTKETAQKAGVASISLLFEIGKSLAKQKLIEHGVHLG